MNFSVPNFVRWRYPNLHLFLPEIIENLIRPYRVVTKLRQDSYSLFCGPRKENGVKRLIRIYLFNHDHLPRSLSIDLPQHNINGPNHRHNIRQQPSLTHGF